MSITRDTAPWKNESKRSKLVKLFIKILITALCFWYISTKIDFAKSFAAAKHASWFLLIAVVFIYVLSKFIAAYRLNIYFKNIRLYLSQWTNLKLYWLGMFYNLFLPGSISGDAYKVVLLNRKLSAPYKKTGAAVLLDRFSGLLGLAILLCTYGVMVLNKGWIDAILICGCTLSILLFYFIIRKFFKDFAIGFWSTLLLGLWVQLVQVVSIYFILIALHIPVGHRQWIFIFLCASVVSVLPLSLGGGLGTREVVFAQGATYFQLDPHLGVTISLLFYLASVAGALPGAYFVFNDPLKDAGIRLYNGKLGQEQPK
jgi:uncharacterized membrane protein YbhN (UPF0104 family)